ncbi:MAG: TIGR01777 family oxidoreductase [Solirubrobacteraceae bacterium]
MRVTVTGASGLIGSALVQELTARGDEVTALSRNPEKGVAWDPARGPAPAEALAGRDAVVHLAGENLAQRWSDHVVRRIRESRERGTRALVDGIRAADPRPRTLVSVSAVGYYGDRGDERLDDDAPPGDDFLANVCIAWEREAQAAADLGLRVVRLRNGVVLDRRGGALSKMLPPFKLGVAGPVAGGRQYMSWIHLEDVVGIIVRALDDDRWTGALNATAPEAVTNAEFSKALGRALHRPAITPVPGFALRLLYGGMADLVTKSQRVVPRRALELGYEHRHTDVEEALRSALA